ncbi:hypothetical protein A1L58_20930 [Shewanella baltica]|nr:hypothetical protein A1L58_20930 [Shewanella baltica]
MQLTPGTTLFLFVLAGFPFALAVNLQPSGIDNQECNRPTAGIAVVNFNRFGALADAAVTG